MNLRSKLPPKLRQFATVGALIKLPLLPFAFLTIAFVLIVRPFIVIKFLKVNPWRIGHLLMEIEVARLNARHKSNTGWRKHFIIYYFPERAPANSYLVKKWKEVLPIIQGNWGWLVMSLAQKISSKSFTINASPRDLNHLLPKTPENIRFSDTEIQHGDNFLQSVNCANKKFVCLMVRDSAYLSAIRTDKSFLKYEYRDSEISTYREAAEFLTELGYTVFRMGQIVKSPLISDNPKIIDYATNGMRTEFLDLYLGANCQFCISTGTGYDCIPQIFRRPIIYVNMVGFYEDIATNNFIIHPKIYQDIESQKFLSLREIAKRGIASEVEIESFIKTKTIVNDLTSIEILTSVSEMESRVNNSYLPSDLQIQLRDRSRKIFETDPYLQGPLNSGVMRGEFASCFLEKYPNFLD